MVGVVALWSIVPVLVKLLIPVVDPFTISFLRLFQALAVVLAAYLARGHRLRQIRLRWWHLIGGMGVGLNYSLFTLSLSFTTASAGVLMCVGRVAMCGFRLQNVAPQRTECPAQYANASRAQRFGTCAVPPAGVCVGRRV